MHEFWAMPLLMSETSVILFFPPVTEKQYEGSNASQSQGVLAVQLVL